MTSLLSNLVNNPADRIHKIKCKNKHGIKIYETCGTHTKIVTAFLNTQTLEII